MRSHILLKNIFALIFITLTVANAQPYKGYHVNLFDANNISIPFNNVGSIDDFYELNLPESRWQYLKYDGSIVYDQGLWIVGKINDSPRLSFSQWNSTYSPGPIINGSAAPIITKEDSLKYRVYKINTDDTIESNKDIADWPVDLGAPADERGNPIVLGDQTLFSVYNAGNSSNFVIQRWQERGDSLMQPIPIEIRQLVYGYNRYSPLNLLSNVVFFEWEIINHGNETMDSTFIGLWSDIDFLNAQRNVPAVDTLNQLGYMYYQIRDNESYDTTVTPAIGYVLMNGPVVNENNSRGWFKGNYKSDIKNLSLSSFQGINDDGTHTQYGQIGSVMHAWNLSKGLDKEGNIIIDDSTGLPTKFPLSGDPITKSGMLFPNHIGKGGGAGFTMFSGPFTFTPGDTQWVMAALIPSIGEDRFDSIRELRLNAKALRSIPYDQLVDKTVIKIYEDSLPTYFSLSQNYPNPFNNSTEITYTIPVDKVFNDVPVSLKVYNLLGQDIATLVDETQNPGIHSVDWNANGLASGIYFYRLEVSSYTNIKKMILLK